MFVEKVGKNDVTVIHLTRRQFDASCSDEIAEKLTESLDRADKVVINIEEVQLMDSSGLGVLLNAYKDINAKNGELCIVTDNQVILNLFDLVYLNSIVKVFPTLDEAISHIDN